MNSYIKENILYEIKNNLINTKTFLHNSTFDNDKDVVLEIVKIHGEELLYVAEPLKDDFDVVLTAVTQYGGALFHASERLKDNKEIAKAALKDNYLVLRYVSDRLKDDPELVIPTIKKHAIMLSHASPRLRNDFDMVLTAIKLDPFTLRYASPRLQDNLIIKWYEKYNKVKPVPSDFKHIKAMFRKYKNEFIKPDPLIESLIEDIQDTHTAMLLLTQYIEQKYAKNKCNENEILSMELI